MENSEKILFADDASQWYVAVGDRWMGPLRASEVYEKIASKEITWAHYVWKRGQADWKRICDTKSFQSVVPHHPGKEITKEVKKDVKPSVRSAPKRSEKATRGKSESVDVRKWFLHYQDSQYGPFSKEEIQHFLKSGKVHQRVHAWREGMKTWERLERIDIFRSIAPKPKAKAQASEQRGNPRRPLVAKILMSDGRSVITGVCRDISIGGLQLLTEQVPGEVGTSLRMNISPASNDSGDLPGGFIEPFVAEGTIVRILEDGRGFSFRFNGLSEAAENAIESFIQSPT